MISILFSLTLFLTVLAQSRININAPPIFVEGESLVEYKQTEFPVLDVALGGYNSVVLTTPTQAFQWGIDKKTINFVEPIKALSCGGYHCLALSESGLVYEWGQRDTTVERISEPTLITELKDKKVVKISAGFRHNIAVLDNGEVYTWGETLSGKVAHSEMSEKHISPSLIPELPTPIVDGSCGGDHTVLLDDEGYLWSFGSNTDGQLGRRSHYVYCYDPMSILKYDEKTHQLSAGGDHTLLISESGKVYSFGWGEKGQLGHGSFTNEETPKEIKLPPHETPLEVATGAYGHSLILTKEGNVYAFGMNDFGQLGMESRAELVNEPTKINGLKDVKHIYGGGFKHSAVLKNDETLVLFGDNTFAQLGPRFGQLGPRFVPVGDNHQKYQPQIDELNLA